MLLFPHRSEAHRRRSCCCTRRPRPARRFAVPPDLTDVVSGSQGCWCPTDNDAAPSQLHIVQPGQILVHVRKRLLDGTQSGQQPERPRRTGSITNRSSSLRRMASSPSSSNSGGMRNAWFRPLRNSRTWRSGSRLGLLGEFDGICRSIC